MLIATHTASPAIRRVLESIILAAGHQLATRADSAELLIHDTLHPASTEPPPIATLKLVSGNASSDDTSLNCPLRPHLLIQRLMMRERTQAIALGNGWSLEPLARQLSHTQAPALPLTEKECSLLAALAQARPEPLSRETLLEQVWGMASEMDTHTLETHVYRLRAKLEPLAPAPGDIVTGGGAYRWVTKD